LDDVDAFWALRLRALREHPGAFASAFEESRSRPRDAVRRDFQARNTGPESIVIGAFESDSLVGTAGCFREQGAKLRHKAIIWGVYVAPEARGRGVGRALVEAAVATARSWDEVEEVRLSVASDNVAACRLYRALGFVVYGVEPRALKLPDRYVDEDHMVLRLR
jgi:ribosomal protein S18 acetylase RimI-like enzyme